jgi:tRNA 2-thiouridine synthesizing protein A
MDFLKEGVMDGEIKVSKTMDLKGLPCPQPVIKVSKGIKEIEVGQVVEAITTDPGALADFPAWARTSGNEILNTEQESGLIRFLIKRVK